MFDRLATGIIYRHYCLLAKWEPLLHCCCWPHVRRSVQMRIASKARPHLKLEEVSSMSVFVWGFTECYILNGVWNRPGLHTPL